MTLSNGAKVVLKKTDFKDNEITFAASANVGYSTFGKEDFLNAAKEQIDAEYGSVQAYLKKGIGLSAEEIERLRSILLIDNG